MLLPDPEAGRQAEIPVQHERGQTGDAPTRRHQQEQKEVRRPMAAAAPGAYLLRARERMLGQISRF